MKSFATHTCKCQMKYDPWKALSKALLNFSLKLVTCDSIYMCTYLYSTLTLQGRHHVFVTFSQNFNVHIKSSSMGIAQFKIKQLNQYLHHCGFVPFSKSQHQLHVHNYCQGFFLTRTADKFVTRPTFKFSVFIV